MTDDLLNDDQPSDDDEIRLLRMELVAARRRLADARFERDAAVADAGRYIDQLRALHGSRSWRITRPLRAFGRRSRGGSF